MSPRDELLDLVDRYLAGTLSGHVLTQFENRLREEPAACRMFWAALNHELLLRQYPFAEAAQPRTAAAAIPLTTPWWQRPARRLAASAAVLLIALGALVLPTVLPSSNIIARIAMITAPTGDAGLLHRANQQTEPLRADVAIHAGDRIAVALGATVEVRFVHEDTVLGLGSRTTVRLTQDAGGTQLGLDSGTLRAAVAAQAAARQLTVTTPQATIAVIGTRFSVTANDARTSVEVDHGRVRVSAADAASIDLTAGQGVVAEPGKPLTTAWSENLRWDDRRPLGVMMLCRDTSGWATNPRGWFGDAKVDVTTPAGLTAFNRRLDTLIDSTIANLKNVNAQGVLFWDLEGLEHAPGYVGDARLLSALAPEMDAAADRIIARIRSAGFAIGMTVRTEAAELPAGGALVFRRVSDPTQQVQAKIAYAQRRWGATIFPILGNGGDALTMSAICRRISAASPGVLLIPTGADGDTYRWSAPWVNPAQPATITIASSTEARRGQPHAFAVIAPLEKAYLQQHYADLVQAVRAGDVLTFRAWNRNAEQQTVRSIYGEAKP
ncbi:MAG: FecR domain-containing protein [Planctomycetes bacterium]|nr:FecR domain-containing protein [Planctomycetota bacterium]